MALLGLFGIIACYKYFERFDTHYRRTKMIELKLAEIHPEVDTRLEWEKIRLRQRKELWLSSRVQIFTLWVVLHAVVVVSGVTLTILILAGVGH
ncbi:hypothetical protein [Actinomycetospora atypica]|uniref:Uncharacterized protein n=1 Tax=Actinomycetospora atypica TaxID=1290095 RepID=A0ABV9YDB4_9PSEU